MGDRDLWNAVATGFEFRRSDVKRRWSALVYRSVPHAAAKGSYIYRIRVGGSGNDAMSPFEVESRNPAPVAAAIPGDPGRRFKSGGVQAIGNPRVNRHVINMAVAVENLPPVPARVFRQEYPAAVSVHPRSSGP